jgi:pimeloyl-ACP methyl ester carboxylesterase/DNA-binding winged helix-turn-helix (wHTH) protein
MDGAATYAFGEHELDLRTYELRRNGTRVAMEPQVFDVLAHLVRNRDRVVTKEELFDAVWGTRFVTESALTTRLKEARRAVGDDGTRQRVIRTLHGRGYRFVADVARVGTAGDGGPEQAPAVDLDRSAGIDDQQQDIRFCRSADGVGLAYAQHGDGPPLVKAANWLTHLDYDWESPVWRHWLRTFGESHRVLRYDERGCGLSDRDVDGFALEPWVRDLETVVDDAGLERFPLLGISQGAAVAIAYAVAHPERVTHLVLYGAYARGQLADGGSDRQREEAQVIIDLARVGWGRRNPAFRQIFSTSFMPEGTAEQWQAFDELQQRSTSPENAARFLEAFFRLDVRELAPHVSVPTIVLHCRRDLVWPYELGRRLAASIPGSRFVPLESRNHLIFEHEPAWPTFVDEVERFLST